MRVAGITVLDRVVPADFQKALWTWLNGPGWTFGAYSHGQPNPVRYLYKHFAGMMREGDPIEGERNEKLLKEDAPLVYLLWTELKKRQLAGHELTRCYANGYPAGTEGGVHQDARICGTLPPLYFFRTSSGIQTGLARRSSSTKRLATSSPLCTPSPIVS